jgi:hypothetical protein
MINDSRRPCPHKLARGQCLVPNCAYNHGPTSMEASVGPNNDHIKAQTGSDGQFVGSRKGGNAVPIKQTGDIPSFLQNRLTPANAAPPRPPVVQQSSYESFGFSNGAPARRPVAPVGYGYPVAQPAGPYGVRSGGNEHEIGPSGMLANIPAQREAREEPVRIDWKAAAMSRVATFKNPDSAPTPRRRELENELSQLQSIEGERRQYLSQLDNEVDALRKRRDQLTMETVVDVRQTQAASDQLLAILKRSEMLSEAIEEERMRMREAFDLMESTGLVDMREIYRAQSLVLDEVFGAFQRYKTLTEYTLCEFKHVVFKARNNQPQ